ncbi:MarR family transcriptional regulator [Clavibacter tessellarius]|uniref:MarR family transcriptional regulator n=1 Tax=Clavibacter tessellarius TaxID=31965 RepID=A0A225C6Y5_9MICO|nr:MarR family transcriptional regulator [Clavibacter michiganensis]MBT1636602.1 MarR family transcriptional regulator [Clavibacter michiganensis]OQJ62637.1 MarR family transcriptional regulator [Clavibacter michiganensis subsp. tessellarius]UKF34371.1 MarR family transcriptional regulator [Clavibacter michiganensis subsp. tessellarius]
MKDDDDVDLVIDAWGAALPDVDFAPLDVVSRLRRLLPQMQRIREGAFAAEGLTTSEFEFLSILRQQGDAGLTRAALAERLGTDTGSLVHRVNRLTARSFITREEDPSGGRSRLVVLTPFGIERVDRAMRRLVADEDEVLADLSRAQIATLIDSLRVIARTTERMRTRRSS